MHLLEKCIFFSKRSEQKHMFSSEQKKVNRVGASTFLQKNLKHSDFQCMKKLFLMNWFNMYFQISFIRKCLVTLITFERLIFFQVKKFDTFRSFLADFYMFLFIWTLFAIHVAKVTQIILLWLVCCQMNSQLPFAKKNLSTLLTTNVWFYVGI